MTTGQQLQHLLSADHGSLVAGTWLLVVAICISAPVALVWCAAMAKRGRR